MQESFEMFSGTKPLTRETRHVKCNIVSLAEKPDNGQESILRRGVERMQQELSEVFSSLIRAAESGKCNIVNLLEKPDKLAYHKTAWYSK